MRRNTSPEMPRIYPPGIYPPDDIDPPDGLAKAEMCTDPRGSLPECSGNADIAFIGMSEEQFTARAAALWGTIPSQARERLLKNVFCVRCGDSVEITKFTGEERDGNMVLKGSCAKCGHAVSRVLETSQVDSSGK
jgi:hypothetical protein